MSTPFDEVYDAFLVKLTEDEWVNWEEYEVEQDLEALLMCALPYFKFPRTSLEFRNSSFINDLSNIEIQILATYMKCEWLNRTIMTWENVKPLYEERDFSQANLIAKFNELLSSERKNAAKLEANYYRSVNGKPFDYSALAGN